MKQTTPDTVVALTSQDGARIVELWTFVFASGETKRWTSASADITFDGRTWVAGEAYLSKGKLFSAVNEVGDLTVQLVGSVEIGGVDIIEAGCGSVFDGATVTLERLVYSRLDGLPKGLYTIFRGKVMPVRPSTTRLELVIRSALALVSDGVGTRPVEVACPFSVYDADCGAAVQEAGATVAAGSTTVRVNLASVPATAVPGSQITFELGPLAGMRSLIRTVGAGWVDLARAISTAPAAGVTVTIRRGCDKRLTTCRTVFSNAARYGGAPFRPRKKYTYA